MLQRAIFLDRDGVINRVIMKEGKPYSPRKLSDFQLTDGIKGVLDHLKEAGFLLIVVTNQPDISRGLITWDALEAIHNLIRPELPVDDIIVCPHDDADECDCRKPKPGLIIQAQEKYQLDLGKIVMVGDSAKDIECARNAGCGGSILVQTGNGLTAEKMLAEKGIVPGRIAVDFYDAAHLLTGKMAIAGQA